LKIDPNDIDLKWHRKVVGNIVLIMLIINTIACPKYAGIFAFSASVALIYGIIENHYQIKRNKIKEK